MSTKEKGEMIANILMEHMKKRDAAPSGKDRAQQRKEMIIQFASNF